MSNVWLITGTSTGFGRDLAIAALENGDRVAATARKPEVLADLTDKYGDRVLALKLDVTKPNEIAQAVKAAHETFGRLDVVVNNAGFGIFGAFEEITDAQFREQYETNVFGVNNVIREVLPILKAQKSGWILNVSSIVGLVSPPGMSAYGSSKFALEGITEALAAELKPFGIKVVLVEPGAFRTAFGATGVPKGANPLPGYEETSGGTIGWLEGMVANGTAPGDPKKAAQAMLKVMEQENPPLRLLLGNDALAMFRQKNEALVSNINALESVTTQTDFAF